MVGHRPLEAGIGVRIPVPEQLKIVGSIPAIFDFGIRASRTPYQERWETEGVPDGGRGAAERFGERAGRPAASETLNPCPGTK